MVVSITSSHPSCALLSQCGVSPLRIPEEHTSDHEEDAITRPPLIVKITGYRLLVSAVLTAFSIPKAVIVYEGRSMMPTTLDWFMGLVCALLLYWLGLFESVSPPISPRLFHRDYAPFILDCLISSFRRTREADDSIPLLDPSPTEDPHCPNILLDGYLAHKFRPPGVERYLARHLKIPIHTLILQCNVDGWPHAVFIAHPSRAAQSYTMLLDYAAGGVPGTVVPQRLWAGSDCDGVLQMPIFFLHEDGSLGVPLKTACGGNLNRVCGINDEASLGGNIVMNLLVVWKGYKDWKRLLRIRDETVHRRPITLKTLLRQIGLFVDAFLGLCQEDPAPRSASCQWHIGGANGISRDEVVLIGVIHVAADCWISILKVSRYI
ncbi:hypothetical protein FA95DRAFT_1568144 [Auriscalpium vulgare]|uniref:Uncharacterized protein n=1 Tax=Auriscalpium vulgare TaxID=40419 RepID=A0ACB8R0Q5_9AGAM|nr:hypothetical protein FA95DRAFT_1568144 [Auriscalpium vulgare]